MPALPIAGIALVIAALFALLLYYGVELIAKVIKSWTPSIGIPGIGNLRDIVSQLIDDAMGVIRRLMLGAVHAIVQLLEAIGIWALKIFGALEDAIIQAVAAVFRVVAVHLPAAIVHLINYADALVHAAAAELGARIGQLRADVHGWLNDLRGWVTAAVSVAVAELSTRLHQLRTDVFAGLDALRTWTSQLVAGAVAQLGHELSALRNWTIQRVVGVEHDLSNAVHGLEAEITAGVAQAIHAVDIDLVAPLEHAWQGLATDVGALEGVLATDFPDIGALLKDLDLSKIIDLAGVSALGLTIARVLSRYLERCGIPNCRNLSGWAHELSNLLNLVGDAGMLAFLIAMITDPSGTAREVDDILGALARPFVGEVRTLIGV